MSLPNGETNCLSNGQTGELSKLELSIALVSVGAALATITIAMGAEEETARDVERRKIQEAEAAERARKEALRSQQELQRQAENAAKDKAASEEWARRRAAERARRQD